METEKCKALLTVLNCGNIRSAAAELGYTPSGVSRMMASLEDELGVTLLIRSKTGVAPTEACQQLLPAFKRLASARDALAQAAQDLTGLETGTLRIGTAYPQFNDVLTPVLREFHRAHPGITISLKEANSTPLAELLDTGELDFALMSRRAGTFAWQNLLTDQLMAVVPADHALADEGGAYPMEQFQTDPYVEIGPGEGTDNQRAFAERGIQPRICHTVSSDVAGYQLVAAGLGVALTNASHLRRIPAGARALPTRPAVEVEIGIGYAAGDLASPAAAQFAAFAIPRISSSMDARD